MGPVGNPGLQGVIGPTGADGQPTYTWIKYADSPVSGMSDDPTNKGYMGLAHNKTTAVESSVYADYSWSLTVGDQGIPGPTGADGQPTYIWIKYGTSAAGAGLTDNPFGMTYIGIAYNKLTQTESLVATDYIWSLIQGPQGIPGPNGADGQPRYSWIKYGTSSAGAGLNDSPVGMTYMGIAYNKTTASESAVATDYEWSLIQGPVGNQGIQGPVGPNGQPTYSWIKYGTSAAGAGLNDSPVGMTHMGIAYNKTTQTESGVPGDYEWSLIQGPQGNAGATGNTGATGSAGVNATSVTVGNTAITIPADNAGGTLAASSITVPFAGWVGNVRVAASVVVSTLPAGITVTSNTAATNAANGSLVLAIANASSLGGVSAGDITLTFTCNGSTFPTLLSWAKSFSGAVGNQGIQGPVGPNGTPTYTWLKYGTSAAGAGLNDLPAGMTYIGLAYNKTTQTESTVATDYEWSLIQGPQGNTGVTGNTGSQGIQGPIGPNGLPTYTWLKYGTSAAGAGLNDSPVGMTYMGIAYNKTTQTESTVATDYEWSLIQGATGATGATGNTGSIGTSVSTLTKYYQLAVSQPAAPTVLTPVAPWTTTEPTYTPGSSDKLYTVLRTVLSTNAFSYSLVSLDVSFVASTAAMTTANGKSTIIRSTTDAANAASYDMGDQWWKLAGTQVIAMWLHDGAAWVSQTLTSSVITNLDAGVITAGFIDVDRIDAASIVVGKLAPDVTTPLNAALPRITGSTLGRVGRSVVAFTQSGNPIPGDIVIDTTIPFANNIMTKLDITGYNYQANLSEIDVKVSCYINTTGYANHSYTSSGSKTIKVKLAKKTATGFASIILTPSDSSAAWHYPKINVDAVLGHSTVLDAYFTGWVTSIKTDLTGYEILVSTPPARDLNDTNTLTQGWRTTGQTTIDGGKVTADSITAIQMKADSIEVEHLSLGAEIPVRGSIINRVPASVSDVAYWSLVKSGAIPATSFNPVGVLNWSTTTVTTSGIQLSVTTGGARYATVTATNKAPASGRIFVLATGLSSVGTALVVRTYPNEDGTGTPANITVVDSGEVILTAGHKSYQCYLQVGSTWAGTLISKLEIFEVIGEGNAGMQSATLSPAGIRLTSDDGSDAINITTNSNQFIAIQKNTGLGFETVASIDADGDGVFQQLDAQSDLFIRGIDVVGTFADSTINDELKTGPLLDRMPWGIVMEADAGATQITTAAARVGIASGSVYLSANRVYELNVLWRLFAKCTAGSGLGSPTLDMHLSNVQGTITTPSTAGGFVASQPLLWSTTAASLDTPYMVGSSDGVRYAAFSPAVSGLYYVMISIFNSNTARTYYYAPTSGTRVRITDVGPSNANWDVGSWETRITTGAPAVPPATTVTRTYNMAWSRSWNNNGGSVVSGSTQYSDAQMMYQGLGASAMGSMMGWSALGLSGKVASKIEIYIRNRHTYSSGGVTIRFGSSTAGYTVPATHSTANAWTKAWSKGVGAWYTIPSSLYVSIMSGSIKSLAMGISGSGGDYAYFDGVGKTDPPKLRVTYK
jgi:hypothetical protein